MPMAASRPYQSDSLQKSQPKPVSLQPETKLAPLPAQPKQESFYEGKTPIPNIRNPAGLLNLVPAYFTTALAHEGLHGWSALNSGAPNVEYHWGLYPSVTASIGEFSKKEKLRYYAAGPLYDLGSDIALNALARSDILGLEARPYVASLAFVSNMKTYYNLLGAPLQRAPGNDMYHISKESGIDSRVFFGMGVAKLLLDIFVTHDTRRNLYDIAGAPRDNEYVQEESNVILEFSGDTIGVNFKF